MEMDEVYIESEKILSKKIFREMGVGNKKKVYVLKGKSGVVIMKKPTTLTKMLIGLVKGKSKEWKESEYSEYLLYR